jgi:fructose-bisphosphate aldolase class II
MLVNMQEMLKDAQKGKYAIGSINTPNIETLRAVVYAAEELNTPIIIDHAQVHDPIIPIEFIGTYMIEYAKKAKVPVCVHLDHASDYTFVMRSIRQGFTSIMYDCSALPFEDNVKNVKEFTEIAHKLGITVEAELGVMTSSAGDTHGSSQGNASEANLEQFYTDPDLAGQYVERTGADALAVCFGTVHGIYVSEPKLDIERLKKIKSKVGNCALVMHGASGVDAKQTRDAISNGICKVNYYTYMSTAVAPKLVEMINQSKNAVYFHDISLYATEIMKDLSKETIKVFLNR